MRPFRFPESAAANLVKLNIVTYVKLSKHELKRYNKWKRMTKDERRNLMHAGSLASGGTTAGSGGGAGETDDRVTFEQEEEFEGKKGTHRKKFKQRVPKL